ncbi:tetratricopeptide repeat protein [Nitzschia inconspicua]|uniref:Tetratricopeptide repeat protein n=1 Tax=Nitzschia inconspicua TaxID=303405 RepID=A0A9K3KPA6_9STRA|nr:tetratricopeptide repeat protein [Nitzschia inconspicua]
MAAESSPPTATAKALETEASMSSSSVTDDSAVISTTQAKRPGRAGNIDYDKWDKKARDLVQDVEQQDQEEQEASKKALGLDGKYALSAAEKEERQKAKNAKMVKKKLEQFQKRESSVREELRELLGPVNLDDETKSSDGPKTVRITRDMIDAGKRVVCISDTSGASQNDTIVLTADLSLLESKMKANATQTPKAYPEDSENAVEEKQQEEEKERKIFGIIKCFLSNVHNCTILIKCKVISGTLELSHCTNVVVKVEKEATIATVQADLCEDLTIAFNDAPSGKNMQDMPGQKRIYWGQDKEDRIFHAGVKNTKVQIYRDGYLETERTVDYVKDGAKAIGNASEKEFQFVTSCGEDGELMTEAVVREGSTTGQNARPMTKRDLEAEKQRREKAANMAVHMAENMIKFKEVNKEGAKKVVKSTDDNTTVVDEAANEEDELEEVYASMSKEEIDAVVKECDQNKARGNEAFGAGEYAQAILLYSLALDKADELPDANDPCPAKKQLFPRDVVLSNRAASFLKLGQHEKAAADAQRARKINPQNVKALFRHGLALHAMKDYEAAIPVLAEAHKIEPKNKQIKEALQFAEVRMNQEMRKRMQGSNQ